MIKKALIFTFICFTFFACHAPKGYTDYSAPLRTDNLQKITITFSTESKKSIVISDQTEMEEFIIAINHSTVNGPWKGAGWDKITLVYDHGQKEFNTNGKVFGQGGSGTFYDLDEKYHHYWE